MRLRTQFPLLTAFLTLLFFSGCGKKKEPQASFTLERYEYTTGETIRLVNTSKDAEGYIWSFPDGRTSFEENPVYTTDPGSRNWTESIQLIAHDKKNRNQHALSQTYTLSIASQPDEFFKLDSITKKPIKKFIADLGNGLTSYRFLEGGDNPLFQGRILFTAPLPPPGNYEVDNLAITVEASDVGYTGNMRYKTNVQWGGTIQLVNDINNRMRMILKDLRLYEPSTNKEIRFSAELTF